LANVAKALAARPELQLEIEGNVQPELDGQALRRARLESELRTEYWHSLRASAREKTKSEDIALTPEQHDELLTHAYRMLLKTNPAVATVAMPGTLPSAKPPPPLAQAAHVAPADERGATRLLDATLAVLAATPASATAPAANPSLNPARDAKPTPEQMELRLMTQLPISDTELAVLATERARQVQTNLVQELHVAAERVLLSQPANGIYATNGNRVTLQLR